MRGPVVDTVPALSIKLFFGILLSPIIARAATAYLSAYADTESLATRI
jgi:hypothetical protein